MHTEKGVIQMIKQRDFVALEDYVRHLMTQHTCPGLALAIAVGDDVIYAEGFGRRNESNDPVTTDTILGVASVTKAFTSVAINQLVDAGKLSLEDSVTKYLPSFNLPGVNTDDIKLIHLLNHTSGLPLLPAMRYAMRSNTPSDSSDTAPTIEEIPMNTTNDLLQYIAQGPHQALGAPGRYINYSNDGYGLLGAIVEDVSGQPYGQYVAEHILKPLGMSRSTCDSAELMKYSDVTELYYHDDQGDIRHTKHWSEAPPHVACGWMKSSANDLVRFWQMLANKGTYKSIRLLSPEACELIVARQVPFTLQRRYALGVRVQPNYVDHTLVEHTGGLRGVAANAGFIKDEGITVVALSNLSGFPITLVWSAAINTMLGLPVDHPRHEYNYTTWNETVMQRRSGTYQASEGWSAPITIGVSDGQLIVTMDDETLELHPVTEDVAVIDKVGQDMGREIRFYDNDTGFTWAIGHSNRIFPRSKNV